MESRLLSCICGIDIVDEAVRYATQRDIPRAAFSVGNVLALGYFEATFNVVTMMEVIEHIPDKTKEKIGGIRKSDRFLCTSQYTSI